MNYLAHAYLSFNHPEILAGNMISDFIKGKKRFDFSENIQKGIMFHRNIDAFTDAHEATKKAKEYFKPAVGLYAGAFADVMYDHFLALDKNEFNNESLHEFSLSVYAQLDDFTSIFPEKFKRIFPYMKKDNWLYNYSTVNGIEKSFNGLARRAAYLDNSDAVFESFKKNYDVLKNCYADFFPEVKQFAYKEFLSMNI
ncbi:MAG: ACP phosphodiesterase [Parafilimonas sp.]